MKARAQLQGADYVVLESGDIGRPNSRHPAARSWRVQGTNLLFRGTSRVDGSQHAMCRDLSAPSIPFDSVSYELGSVGRHLDQPR